MSDENKKQFILDYLNNFDNVIFNFQIYIIKIIIK